MTGGDKTRTQSQFKYILYLSLYIREYIKKNTKLIFTTLSEKKRYRESYISDDLDLDPHGSESSPGLSRHSTSSSGIEADGRQHSVSTDMASLEEESQQYGEKCFISAANHGSSCSSDLKTGSKTVVKDEECGEEG